MNFIWSVYLMDQLNILSVDTQQNFWSDLERVCAESLDTCWSRKKKCHCIRWLNGLGVWFLLWVQEVSSSNLDWAQHFAKASKLWLFTSRQQFFWCLLIMPLTHQTWNNFEIDCILIFFCKIFFFSIVSRERLVRWCLREIFVA